MESKALKSKIKAKRHTRRNMCKMYNKDLLSRIYKFLQIGKKKQGKNMDRHITGHINN